MHARSHWQRPRLVRRETTMTEEQAAYLDYQIYLTDNFLYEGDLDV